MYSDLEIIAAPATPVVRAPLALIRVSGPGCWEVANHFFKPFKGVPKPWKAQLGTWSDEKGYIDEVIVVPYQQGSSYTGQEMFEIACHGNPVLVHAILDSMKTRGVRLAKPGEFTSRAVLSGKMSLFEAERIQAVIEAKTRYHAEIIYQQSHNPLIPRLQELVVEVLKVQAHIEANIDYGEDDIDALDVNRLVQKLQNIEKKMETILKASVFPRKMRQGFHVLLTGDTNVGKSSLFNALCNHQRAIVTDIPGTTRDLVHEEVEIEGIPIVFIDSAGVRETGDYVEKLGIERIKQTLPDMDMVMFLTPLGQEAKVYSELETLLPGKLMYVYTQSDKAPNEKRKDDESGTAAVVSIYEEESIQSLKKKIVTRLGTQVSGHYLVTQRQEDVFSLARKEIQDAAFCLVQGYGEEVCASHLNAFRSKIGELTGETTVEDILDHMFSDFCLGK